MYRNFAVPVRYNFTLLFVCCLCVVCVCRTWKLIKVRVQRDILYRFQNNFSNLFGTTYKPTNNLKRPIFLERKTLLQYIVSEFVCD